MMSDASARKMVHWIFYRMFVGKGDVYDGIWIMNYRRITRITTQAEIGYLLQISRNLMSISECAPLRKSNRERSGQTER